MMKTTLPYRGICRALFIITISLLGYRAGYSQSFKGKDGNAAYNSSGTYIFNRYASLAGTATAGSLSITVTDITHLSGSYSFTNSHNPYHSNSLSKGDLVMIIQVQGANIITSDNASYGTITNYNGTGQYELRTVFDVTGNTILLCENLAHTYTQSSRSRAQVIRIPRFNNLSIAAGATISAKAWDGGVGGVVAIETDGTLTLNGQVSASRMGFRGGIDDKTNSSPSGSAVITLYRTTVTTTTATKGESIAGNANDYATLLQGANGRGAPANGGGGGNGHNSGGGGGANAGRNGTLLPWNGTGIKNTSGTGWADAWNLETDGFATDTSTGGGRGGYSFSNSNQDALTLAPGKNAWGGDKRQIVGGFGGRPLNYSGNNVLFMGGGGGAGDGNNNVAGNGGNGGGIAYILSNGLISGTGTITANGQNGYNTEGSNIDAAGGGGGGGAIVILSNTGIAGITAVANGGKGGDQLALSGEAEGPGGGGGGGYIAISHPGISCSVQGGTNGISNSTHVTEFLPNGATIGANGTIASRNYITVESCDTEGFVLPIQLLSFQATWKNDAAQLIWVSQETSGFSHFELEQGHDGVHYQTIAVLFGNNSSGTQRAYQYTDASAAQRQLSYYRLKMVDRDGQVRYSEARLLRRNAANGEDQLSLFPNPASTQIRARLPVAWQNRDVHFEIIDLSGRIVRTTMIRNSNAVENISLQALHTGVYIIRARCSDATIQGRFVRN